MLKKFVVGGQTSLVVWCGTVCVSCSYGTKQGHTAVKSKKKVPATRRQLERTATLGDKGSRERPACVKMQHIYCVAWLERVAFAAVSGELASGTCWNLHLQTDRFCSL